METSNVRHRSDEHAIWIHLDGDAELPTHAALIDLIVATLVKGRPLFGAPFGKVSETVLDLVVHAYHAAAVHGDRLRLGEVCAGTLGGHEEHRNGAARAQSTRVIRTAI